ncbi:SDR family oxidoreductase [Sideroxydans lithotrophicus]|uniref:Short-chain dehydrogenase/reductase SDR n=1 Tax=Sideroxydans lithotrophicus (strain ES-1) TaxID=580332 RepID=D5CS21_SIDLE|nr:SDR family oxidoreductase [Sideroxydans lithotrophicus]ADE11757.1 short-chain dehydrogenase/reductase SDR [Sideroxydans lithotrophicus ES-1]
MTDERIVSSRYSRIAIITGSTSGIGEATARRFVASGYGVVGNGRNAEKLRALEQELGTAFIGIAGDASDSSLLEKLFGSAIEHFGKPADIVVANAGRGLGGSVKDADLSRFEEILRLNVSGVLDLLQKAARKMIVKQQADYPKRAADIVIIGSVVGRHISPFSAVYGATKFAVHSLAEGLRREVGPKGIRVSLVEPGIVVSGFQDAAGYSGDMVHDFEDRFGPLLHGEDVANAIHFIVSQPPHVHISDILVRPTRQDYP